ncbi:MAG: DUF2384 domain-containing protein [Prolixibacteraceae bacterium]|jgi:putative toxin-antitoxin system antitoxin component (TIGR02293 family)|nr:DUF2384 domain-containing protein [Deltaproteobacteria bacterium]MBT6005487.1 DUF2384 domain-containing protein [Prolixibacteraceae bacterium]
MVANKAIISKKKSKGNTAVKAGYVVKGKKTKGNTVGKTSSRVKSKSIKVSDRLPEKVFLGGTKRSARSPGFLTEMGVIEQVRKGIVQNELLILANLLKMTIPDLSKLLPVTARTIQRYNKNTILSKSLSEQVIQIQRLYYKAKEVFEDEENAVRWLKRPCMALNNEKPIDLCDTYSGIELVRDELTRIEYGVFA